MQVTLRSAGAAISALVLLCAGCDRKQPQAVSEAASANVITFTEANFEAEVLSATEPVLVDFWATWCGPCKLVAPVVAELAEEFKGRAKVGKVDIDAQPALAQQYKVSAIPTLVIFKGGKPVDQLVGVQSKEALKAKLEQALHSAAAPSSEPAAAGSEGQVALR